MIDTGLLSQFISYYATLVFIMNPFGAAPIFLDIVEKLHPWERRRLANLVTMVVVALLFLVAFTGDLLLKLYMISVDEFRFAGGIVLLGIALHRLEGHPKTQTPDPRDAALVPLTMPLLVGPATMTYVIVFAAEGNRIALIAAIVAAAATVWAFLLAAEAVLRFVGRSTMRVLMRITSLFVAGVGASMIHSALVDWGIAAR
ncbi:NAAT family transporter [Pyrodictium abyssi]|uniref:UPF0056 membrane protein n=1 Tax=Pyrodictium abyssi TaxID=54256 RepID=A0ABM8IXN4_9CREN|nr:NAAT family transporter [Pyrodictium abyssi]